tara:strand:- start:27 stop:416 length:390 start_codon:yes stop_codon:yes gene_type:complete
MNIEKLKNIIAEFAKERDWDKFHNPKNLVMALSSEVGELSDIFQWLNPEESEKKLSNKNKELAKEEIADILIYLIRLSDKLDIDLENEVMEKIKKNSIKYPVELSKGNAIKYNSIGIVAMVGSVEVNSF